MLFKLLLFCYEKGPSQKGLLFKKPKITCVPSEHLSLLVRPNFYLPP